jgi:SAM-dependent methyltransferase
MTIETTSTTEADRALKAKHRAMWALGDYPALAADIISGLGPILVQACGVRAGDRVLDVAAGSGNAAIPAARTGASVVACDLTPELLEAGQREAARLGVNLRWQPGDAEDLPFGDGEFDTVLSCLGVMFAPHHQTSADELIRVCAPGGTIGLLSWTPEGFIGQLFATMRPYVPPPPPGAQPPPLWAARITSARSSAIRSPTSGRTARVSGSTCSAGPRTSGIISRPATGPQSRPTGPSPPIRNGPRRWTPTSPTSPAATTAVPRAVRGARSWSGSTCCSQRASAREGKGAAGARGQEGLR